VAGLAANAPMPVDFGRTRFPDRRARGDWRDSPDSSLGARRPSCKRSNPADTILINGRIATLAPRAPAASALAIRDGNIAAVGSAGEIEALRGPRTHVIGRGRPHRHPGHPERLGTTHFIRGGADVYQRSCAWDRCVPLAEGLRRRTREQAQRTPGAALGAGDPTAGPGRSSPSTLPDARGNQTPRRATAVPNGICTSRTTAPGSAGPGSALLGWTKDTP